MNDTMTKARTVLMIAEDLRDALRLESALSGKDMAELVEAMIEKSIPDAVRQVRERRSREAKGKKNGGKHGSEG